MPKRTSQGEYIDIIEFARRISVSETTAREMARSRAFCDKHISVNIHLDGKRGGIRINWKRYQEVVEQNPVVPEHKRVMSKRTG